MIIVCKDKMVHFDKDAYWSVRVDKDAGKAWPLILRAAGEETVLANLLDEILKFGETDMLLKELLRKYPSTFFQVLYLAIMDEDKVSIEDILDEVFVRLMEDDDD